MFKGALNDNPKWFVDTLKRMCGHVKRGDVDDNELFEILRSNKIKLLKTIQHYILQYPQPTRDQKLQLLNNIVNNERQYNDIKRMLYKNLELPFEFSLKVRNKLMYTCMHNNITNAHIKEHVRKTLKDSQEV